MDNDNEYIELLSYGGWKSNYVYSSEPSAKTSFTLNGYNLWLDFLTNTKSVGNKIGVRINNQEINYATLDKWGDKVGNKYKYGVDIFDVVEEYIKKDNAIWDGDESYYNLSREYITIDILYNNNVLCSYIYDIVNEVMENTRCYIYSYYKIDGFGYNYLGNYEVNENGKDVMKQGFEINNNGGLALGEFKTYQVFHRFYDGYWKKRTSTSNDIIGIKDLKVSELNGYCNEDKNEVLLSWNKNALVDGYKVFRNGSFLINLDNNTLNYIDKEFKQINNKYYVVGYKDKLNGDISNTYECNITLKLNMNIRQFIISKNEVAKLNTNIDNPEVKYFINDIEIEGNLYTTNSKGVYTVYAKLNNSISKSINIVFSDFGLGWSQTILNKKDIFSTPNDYLEVSIKLIDISRTIIPGSDKILFNTYVNDRKIDGNILKSYAPEKEYFEIEVIPINFSTEYGVISETAVGGPFLDDYNFRKEIEKKLLEKGINSTTVENVKLIEELDISGKNIKEINGIAAFTNLKKLNVSNNSIQDLERIDSLANLETLNISNNPLKEENTKILNEMKKRCLIKGDISTGVVKIANSWGEGWGDKGFFYMTYNALKKYKMNFQFVGWKDKDYEPKAIAVFEIESEQKEKIDIWIKRDGEKIKRFPNYTKRYEDIKERIFPDNKVILDITEFLPITNETISLFVEGNGVLKLFEIETYNNNYLDSLPEKTFRYVGGEKTITSTGIVASINNVTILKESSSSTAFDGISFKEINEEEMDLMKNQIGIYDSNKNYSVDNYFTGFIPPSEKDWETVKNNSLIVDSNIQYLSLKRNPEIERIDYSKELHFPAIVNQKNKNSCVAFALGYYTAGFYTARNKNYEVTINKLKIKNQLPTQNLDSILSPDFVYNLNKTDNIDGGSVSNYTYNIISDLGISSWKRMPYLNDETKSKWGSEAAFREAPLYRTEYPKNSNSFGVLQINSEKDIISLKDLLSRGFLLNVTFNINMIELITKHHHTVTSAEIVNSRIGLHEVTVIGFDNNYKIFKGNLE